MPSQVNCDALYEALYDVLNQRYIFKVLLLLPPLPCSYAAVMPSMPAACVPCLPCVPRISAYISAYPTTC